MKGKNVLHIKNMVCPRCISVVRGLLGSLDLEVERVELGQVKLLHPLPQSAKGRLATLLQEQGFELLEDARRQQVSAIKSLLIERIHRSDALLDRRNISDYLSSELAQEYSQLSKLFSAEEGQTIEQFVLAQRMERAKELLSYGELNVNEIADELGYSSVQHFSTQFKKMLGLTPTQFRQLEENRREPLDGVGERGL